MGSAGTAPATAAERSLCTNSAVVSRRLTSRAVIRSSTAPAPSDRRKPATFSAVCDRTHTHTHTTHPWGHLRQPPTPRVRQRAASEERLDDSARSAAMSALAEDEEEVAAEEVSQGVGAGRAQ
jgi:hypothetical protein